jgi:large subunit ribosomal protein L31
MNKQKETKWYPETKVYCDGEVVMVVGSTQPEIRVEVWSGNHPFYCGSQKNVRYGRTYQ